MSWRQRTTSKGNKTFTAPKSFISSLQCQGGRRVRLPEVLKTPLNYRNGWVRQDDLASAYELLFTPAGQAGLCSESGSCSLEHSLWSKHRHSRYSKNLLLFDWRADVICFLHWVPWGHGSLALKLKANSVLFGLAAFGEVLHCRWSIRTSWRHMALDQMAAFWHPSTSSPPNLTRCYWECSRFMLCCI